MNPSPAALQAWMAVATRRSMFRTKSRKADENQKNKKNMVIGAATPTKMGSGGLPGGAPNAPTAPSTDTSRNHAASTTATVSPMPWVVDDCEVTKLDMVWPP